VKIIFLSTGRDLRPEIIDRLRDRLGLQDSDVVCLVSWHRAHIPLQVSRHLVIGPHLRVIGASATVQQVQGRPTLIAAAVDEIRAESQRDEVSPADAASAPRAAGATAHLPLFSPRRMRAALAWRVRRNPQLRKLRSQGVSLGFAAGCLRASQVHDMMRDADLVVALDPASHRGAWTLAQKVPGPEVVIGISAAKQVLEQREASTPN